MIFEPCHSPLALLLFYFGLVLKSNTFGKFLSQASTCLCNFSTETLVWCSADNSLLSFKRLFEMILHDVLNDSFMFNQCVCVCAMSVLRSVSDVLNLLLLHFLPQGSTGFSHVSSLVSICMLNVNSFSFWDF